MSEQLIEPRQLRRQLIKKYPRPTTGRQAEPAATEIVVAALATVSSADDIHRPLLDRLRDAAVEDLEELALSDMQHAYLCWVDEAFRLMLREFPMDGLLAARIQELLPLVAAVAISQKDFLLLEEHPLVQLIDILYIHGLSWHRGLGRAGHAARQAMEAAIDTCLDFFNDQDLPFQAPLAELKKFLADEVGRAERMHERVIASEQGKLKASSARVTAGAKLNELMEGHSFPAAYLEFLQGAWYDSMQLTLITLGPDSDEWQRMLRLTETLVWTIQPFEPNDDQRRQTLYKLIPRIPRELRELLISLANDLTGMDEALNSVEECHFKLLRNRPPPYAEFRPILLGNSSTRTNVSEQMLGTIKPLKTGQWFIIRADDGTSQRVRLALKMNEFEQLLFVNRVGGLALKKTFDEFAYLLTSEVARPLIPRPAMSQCLRAAAGLAANVRTSSAGGAEPGERAASEARKREAARKLQERRKARTSRPDPDPDDRTQASPLPGELSSLSIGTWIRFRDGDSEELNKLAVRIDALDTFIFVNDRGQKQRQINGADLAALVENQQAELVSDSPSFEDAVNSVVRGYREDLGEESGS